jgi:hypothetical protein
MVYIDREVFADLSDSAQKYLKCLAKSSQSWEVARKCQLDTDVNQTYASKQLAKPNTASTSVKLFESPPGTLTREWILRDTLFIKKWLQNYYHLRVYSLVRVGDLGIRSPRKSAAIGVILFAKYSLLNDQSRKQRSVRLYVISPNVTRIPGYLTWFRSGDYELLCYNRSVPRVAHAKWRKG